VPRARRAVPRHCAQGRTDASRTRRGQAPRPRTAGAASSPGAPRAAQAAPGTGATATLRRAASRASAPASVPGGARPSRGEGAGRRAERMQPGTGGRAECRPAETRGRGAGHGHGRRGRHGRTPSRKSAAARRGGRGRGWVGAPGARRAGPPRHGRAGEHAGEGAPRPPRHGETGSGTGGAAPRAPVGASTEGGRGAPGRGAGASRGRERDGFGQGKGLTGGAHGGGGGDFQPPAPRARRGERGSGWAALGRKASWAGRLAWGPRREGRGGEGWLGRLASWVAREGEGVARPKGEERGEREKKKVFFFFSLNLDE
jgi:hypothetical protein